MKSLLWTTTLIFLFVYVLAVYFTQLVLDYRVSFTAEDEVFYDKQLQLYFGSLGRSILTLYEAISGGLDWDALAQPLMGRISVVCAFVLAGYTAFCLLALMNVVTGVFVQAALESAKQDRTSYMLRHVRELFSHADPDNTGSLNWEQFESCLDKDFMQEFFKVIDVDRSDAKNVFALLDSDDSGEINLDEFLNGCLGLHGPAKSLHLATLMYQSRITARYQAMEMEHIYKHLQCIMNAMPSLAGQTHLEKPALDASFSRRKSFQKSAETAAAETPPSATPCQTPALAQPLAQIDLSLLNEIANRKCFQKSLTSPNQSESSLLAHPLAQNGTPAPPPGPSDRRVQFDEQSREPSENASTGSDIGSVGSRRSLGKAPSLGVPQSSTTEQDELIAKTRVAGSQAPLDLS
mmetsp:Transcript_80255/g.125034  ORF Transcript_80255/g.125034 Transcript_80255/m.125034 type:complete len:406 (+) Transcript_80255:1-1218(+)